MYFFFFVPVSLLSVHLYVTFHVHLSFSLILLLFDSFFVCYFSLYLSLSVFPFCSHFLSLSLSQPLLPPSLSYPILSLSFYPQF